MVQKRHLQRQDQHAASEVKHGQRQHEVVEHAATHAASADVADDAVAHNAEDHHHGRVDDHGDLLCPHRRLISEGHQ